MRLFLAAIMVGAAAIGFVYRHQPPQLAVESRPDPGRPLFDWQSADDTLSNLSSDAATADDPPLVVRDTIASARTENSAVLDEFVRVSDSSSVSAKTADVATEADQTATGIPAQALVPFATSDMPTGDMPTSDENASDFAPADASAAVNQPPLDLFDDSDSAPALEPAATIATAPSTSRATTSAAAAAATSAATTAASAAAKSKPAAIDRVATEPASADPVTVEPVTVEPVTAEPVTGNSGAGIRTAGKPVIAEATLIAQRAAPQTEPARKSTVAAKSPKTELLPGGKLPPRKPVEFDRDWKVAGKTTRELPMHTRRFGRQGVRTLIIAGMDGRDLVATHWNDALAEALPQNGELLQSNEILILRAGNPDGLVRRIPANSRGVLINRNFPSRRYQFLTDRTAGPGPASEAETHAILEVLYSFRPRRVIHLASTAGRSTLTYNRAAQDVAAELQNQFKVTAQALDPELVPGSLEDFADGTLDAAVISLKLNTAVDWKQSWRLHLPLVLAAIKGQPALETVSSVPAGSSPDDIGTPIQADEDDAPEPARKRRTGYEELPRPPR